MSRLFILGLVGGAVLCSLFFPTPVCAQCDESALTALLRASESFQEQGNQARLAAAERAAAECPSSALAHIVIGDVWEAAGELGEAEVCYREAASLDPDSAIPWARLASLERRRGNTADFETYLAAAEALAVNENDRDEIARASTSYAIDSEPASDGYSFKEAAQIGDGLKVGSKSIRPKSVSSDYTTEYFIGSKGFGVNLGILFEVGTTNLKPEGSRQVAELGRALERASPSEKYLIEGHSSSEGDPEFNARLSLQRAEAIAALLERNYGIARSQLEFVGRGVEFPVVEYGQENFEKSRRVTVLRLYDE